MKQSSYNSINEMLDHEYLYPDATVICLHNKYYPSIRRASRSEGVSPYIVKKCCIVVSRDEIKRAILSQIKFNI